MKNLLSGNDKKSLDGSIAVAESQTGAQFVLATVKRSDSYPEIPWKAFAIGASVAALAVFLFDLFSMNWITGTTVLFTVSAVLGSGALFGVLTLFIPAFARLFLSIHRAESETRQHAEVMFLSHELFKSEGRRGILLLVSHFERQVVIIPDKGVRERLTDPVMKKVISDMKPFLVAGELREALETGLGELATVLNPSAQGEKRTDDLSNEIIEE
jgi:putative membrane protein